MGTLSAFVRLLQKLNSDRPNGHKKTIDEVTEKLLECIAEASSKFSESAWREYEAEPGEREFEFPVGHVNAGERALYDCLAYYDKQWDLAIAAGNIQKMAKQRRSEVAARIQQVDSVRISLQSSAARVRTRATLLVLLKFRCLMRLVVLAE